ncbi:hypothetical protein [Bradyrhizobium sp. 174]|uniref:hypothetical protein n=1 Tax=Bradyrhizobium sp. 174 TaxID=2782645 RepID=UPI001FF98937|nr:hypothetical protein [Bradyrhizobium sp. 174]MCK1574561.1 hypothetical protein [Bradyrhizobium sp. 174]
MAKKKSIVDRISDTVTEIVDTASAAAAAALKPDPEAVAATTKEQVYIPEATDAAATPAPLFARKKRGPAPMRANKRVAAARAKKTASRSQRAAKQPKKAAARADAARVALPGCESVIEGDLSTLAAMQSVASQANAMGRFDAVIHNVATGYHDRERFVTEDGLARIFAVNVLAPYVLTALMIPPARLIYLSSGMHTGGRPELDDAQWADRRWNASQAYSDTKLHDTILTMAVAARWTHVMANAVDPGWVPTKLGGAGAPDNLDLGADTQARLAVSQEPTARVTGEYFHHRQRRKAASAAYDGATQDRLMAYLQTISGVSFA